MKKLDDLLRGLICKNNHGYRYHRFHIADPKMFFTKSLEISEKDVEIATNILRIININNQEDMFLGLTCIALLSSYEKRRALIAKHSGKQFAEAVSEDNLYMYKAYVNKLIVEGLKKDIDFSFCHKKDEEGMEVTYVSIAGIQFSFHNGVAGKTADFAEHHGLRQYKDLEWDSSVRFQNAPKEVLLFALQLKNTSKLKYIDEKPLDFAKSISSGLYNRGNNGRSQI